MYTYFTIPVKDEGMLNSKITATAMGMHMRSSQTLALPRLEWVPSTIRPITKSDTPSNIFEMAMIVLAAAAFTKDTSVKYVMKNADIIPLTHAMPKFPIP